MAESGRRKAQKTEPARRKKPNKASQAKTGKPAGLDQAAKPVTAPKGASPAQEPVAMGNAKSQTESPRVVFRDGVAYLDEYDIPIWQLEMGRRAGSSPAATMRAFPGLTPQGLDLAFAYAQENRQQIDALIREYGPTDVPAEDEEEDDEAAFEAGLEALLETDAELFRRLAR